MCGSAARAEVREARAAEHGRLSAPTRGAPEANPAPEKRGASLEAWQSSMYPKS